MDRKMFLYSVLVLAAACRLFDDFILDGVDRIIRPIETSFERLRDRDVDPRPKPRRRVIVEEPATQTNIVNIDDDDDTLSP